jgi:hypothetical protein
MNENLGGIMRGNDCWIKSATAKNELKELFSEIDRDLSTSYEESPYTPELSLDGSFGTLFNERSKRYLERFNDERNARGLCRIRISLNQITHSEKRDGADIGLIAHISIPEEIEIKKAVLVQSKRLSAKNGKFDQDCIYNGLFNSELTIEPQWKRMLGITCSSVYFFYNPNRIKIGKSNKNLRTRVLGAQIIEGKANAKVNSFSAKQSYYEGKPFSEWIVDNFICCTVGDTNKKTIETALGKNADFSVHRTLHFVIEPEDVSSKDISN